MEAFSFYFRYTILGICAIIIYSMQISNLMNFFSLMIFTICVFFILILIVNSLTTKKIKYYNEPVPENIQYTYKTILMDDLKDNIDLIKKKELELNNRYLRQELYENINPNGQKTLSKKRITIVGLGRFGSIIAELLTRAGIGTLHLIDHGLINQINIDHNNFFSIKDLKKSKTITLENKLKKINSNINITGHDIILHDHNLKILHSDLVIDCTNNTDINKIINRFCKINDIPLITGRINNDHGMIKIIQNDFACLNCLWNEITPEDDNIKNKNIQTIHMGSSICTTEAIKILLNQKTNYDLVFFSIKTLKINKTKVKKFKECDICS